MRELPNHSIFRSGYRFEDPNNCFSHAIGTFRVNSQNYRTTVIEHVAEKQTVPTFLQGASNRVLPSRNTPGPEYTRLSPEFILQGLDRSILVNPPPMRGGGRSNRPIVRLMNALGSYRNDDMFVLFDARLNGVKERVGTTGS